MINIEETGNLIIVAIIGEFTLDDFRQFEDQVLYKFHFNGEANLLLDWRDMVSYTVGVAWEEIRFMREHGSKINRVAVVADSQWQVWSAWVSNLFIDADVVVFSDYDEAYTWIKA
ncbi:STAS/SEC14 domain-containing protein [Nitrosomonas sp. HPC101]|uniref:STAS/SEC14 domain-containing protein n=1 Tax=Nitrosomonas sp. HPC101 TaxID=1658667 RepID=UPI00136AB31D|nr:STAS/SEC14 domain-containing protein [Nitrosomonas sp. HPC101]MXS86530.1 STAS/SEC14 domain-containing protein [Nitrosomonas sp. HPC101]